MTNPSATAPDLWQHYWDSLTTEWFKLEVVQDYSGEDASPTLTEWQNGNQSKSRQLLLDADLSWFYECQTLRRRGVRLLRIHIVDYPLTSYLGWEIEAYRARNVAIGGEEVYLIERKDVKMPLPGGDVMLFDQTVLARNTYTPGGKLLTQAFTTKPSDLTPALKLRHHLLSLPSTRISSEHE